MLLTRIKSVGIAAVVGIGLIATLAGVTPAIASAGPSHAAAIATSFASHNGATTPPVATADRTVAANGTAALECPYAGCVTISNCDGRRESFLRGGDAALWYRYQRTPGGPFTDWYSLGGWLIYDVDVSRNTDCSLEVFGIGGGNAMYNIWQQPSSPTGWSAWGGLGGVLVSRPYSDSLADGRLQVCAWGPDNYYHCKSQIRPSSHQEWTAW